MKNSLAGGSNLSCGQKALWYLNQLEPHSTAYHLGLCVRFTGSLDERALASAWLDIGIAHPQLRARFNLREGRLLINIHPHPSPLRIETGGPEDLARYWLDIAEHPFDLEHEAPVRALLLHDSTGSYHLLLCLHHIAGDLWSAATVLRELSAGYAAHAAGRTPAIVSEKMAYTEFASAERHWLEGPQGIAAWNFWREYFAGAQMEPILTREVAQDKGGEITIALDGAKTELIRYAAREQKTTPYAVLLACYARLLCEETGRDELVIGTPATLRNHTALRDTVGYLVNAVPVRCPVAVGVGESVSVVAANAQNALKHRRFPFPAVVERLGAPRTSKGSPLFQSMFAYQSLPRVDCALLPVMLNTGGARWEFAESLMAEIVPMPPFDAQFPIALTLGRNNLGFSGCLQFDGRRVTAKNAERLARRFPELVGEFLQRRKPKLPINASDDCFERLEHLFDNTARRTPDAIATSENGLELTYAQVKNRADILAEGLDAALSDHTSPVAIQMPSSAEAAIIILAILKSGRAFQPIDPGEPTARRNAALRSTGACALVLPTGINAGVIPNGVVALSPQKLEGPTSPNIRRPVPSRTAYLVFTSGSSGEPKAVEVEHQAVLNHARASSRIFKLTPQDRILQFHTLAFDASFEEIFPTWASGACIVFEPQARDLGIPALLEIVAERGVTVLNLPTSYWHTLTREAVRFNLRPSSTLRLLVVGGEQASTEIYSAWHKLVPCCRWINTYGPTETTITALSYEPPTEASVQGVLPIGQPIDGVTTLLLNDDGEQISVGEGELLIGGAGLARGYLGDPETTAAKFLTRVVDGEARRFYRTGDRVKLRCDGNFEFLGRLDRQVKIRGYRVDQEELERVLRAHPAVAETAVATQKFKDDLILAAWIVRRDVSLTIKALRAHLSRRLPAHMIPTQLAFVERLPRKPSGKLDVAALGRARPARAAQGDRSLREMAHLFSELLEHKVGPQDDFFLCGGHSLLAIKLLGRVEARFGARISVSDFVAAPTAKGLWTHVKMAQSAKHAPVPDLIPAKLRFLRSKTGL